MTDTAPQQKAPLASEGGHWYDLLAQEARYEVPYADPRKGMRKATIKDARKHGWGPGVTGIIREKSSPQLDNWKQEQAIRAGRSVIQLPDENDDDWLSRAREEANRIGIEASTKGTSIHAEIERAIQGLPVSEEWKPWVDEAKRALDECFPNEKWLAEKVACDAELGYGTKIDLHSPYVLLDWKGIDCTKRDGTPKDGCDDLYNSHFMQLWASANALVAGRGIEVNACCIGFIERPNSWSTVTQPRVSIKVATAADLEKGRRMFLACRTLWIEDRGYNPGKVES